VPPVDLCIQALRPWMTEENIPNRYSHGREQCSLSIREVLRRILGSPFQQKERNGGSEMPVAVGVDLKGNIENRNLLYLNHSNDSSANFRDVFIPDVSLSWLLRVLSFIRCPLRPSLA